MSVLDVFLFVGFWIGGALLTVLGWKLFDGRIFNESWGGYDTPSEESAVVVWFVFLWPMLLAALAVWIALTFLGLVPLTLLFRDRK